MTAPLRTDQPPSAFPPRLGVLPWDVGIGQSGFDPRSSYVETFWLPVLGPSTVLLLRRLAGDLEDAPLGFEVSTETLSRDIGLGVRVSRRAPFVRTLDRCAKFNLVLLEGQVLYVRQRLPGLSPRQVGRLSTRLATLHAQWQRDTPTGNTAHRSELLRAAHVARTLIELGESPHDTERQLDRWGFSPAVSWHAVHCAESEDLDALRSGPTATQPISAVG